MCLKIEILPLLTGLLKKAQITENWSGRWEVNYFGLENSLTAANIWRRKLIWICSRQNVNCLLINIIYNT
jgi:hypothetical protein